MLWITDSLDSPPQESREPFQLPSAAVFAILAVSHVIAATYHPIQDCDEVFNYIEPTHFLANGYGFQTWEYSPAYALRSWAYAGLHALVSFPGKFFPSESGSKAAELFFLRRLLGVICALCETQLCSSLAGVLNPRIATAFVFIMATSPGMAHASNAYLPSSFSMYATMLGMAAFIDWRGGLKTARGILAIGVGACVGWPFVGVMAAPFLLEEAALVATRDNDIRLQFLQRVADGVKYILPILVHQVIIDSFFYRTIVVAPINLVLYNLITGKGGPNLYGTEPWHFYIRNLFLNFHIWFILASLAMPLLLQQYLSRSDNTARATHLRGLVISSPFYLWLAIFTLQPHKEERFMYPAYPALAVNASIACFLILSRLNSTDKGDLINIIPIRLRFTLISGIVLSALAFSALRIVGTMQAYSAPLSIYKPLHDVGIARTGDTVCLGKEWYRFPSHYLLPEGVKAKFIKSEFDGLLPGEFQQGVSAEGTDKFAGAWLAPTGMNDENREDPGKYTSIKECTFIVDSNLPTTVATPLEPNYIADTEHWERVKCLPFMDSSATGLVGRLVWVPDLPMIPQKYKRVYGDYCLLRRRKLRTAMKRDPVPHIETLG